MNVHSVQLDSRIRTTLAALRLRIRAYVWLQGLALVVALAGVLFWMSLGIDWFFEPPVWLRKLLMGASVFGVILAAYRVIGRRAFFPLSDASMAILLERHFRQFDASLLTAVELTARPADTNDCNRDMLAATCIAARERLARVRLADVFNWRPLRTAVLAASLLAGTAVGFGALRPGLMGVWYRRVVLMSGESWPRRTILAVEGFTDGVARVARGADFTLVARADMAGRLVPRSVRVDYRPEGASRSEATMIREGQAVAGRDAYQTYSYSFRNVLAPVELGLRGGDASIRNLRIEVVEAPSLVRLEAECRYPDYMWRPPQTVPAAGVVPVPRGTSVTLLAEGNKRLAQVEIIDGETTRFISHPILQRLHGIIDLWRASPRPGRDGKMTGDGARRLETAAEELAQLRGQAGSLLSGQIPGNALSGLVAEVDATRNEILQTVAGRSGAAVLTVDERLRRLQEAVGQLASFAQFKFALEPIHETKTLELVLHDSDGIKSRQPIRLVLSAVEDQPPQAAVQLDGIGSAITPQARLPFRGEVHDDHGVDRVWLEYAVEGVEPRQQTLKQLGGIATEVPIDAGFDVDRLALSPGSKILVAVKAQDRCTLGEGANVGSGDRWGLDVVTAEKLRAMLEAREIVLRQRFETIVEDLQGIRDTLAGLAFGGPQSARLAPREALEPGESERPDTPERRLAVQLLRIQRSRQNGQKDSHETAGIAEAFQDIRQELVNNRIYTEELRIRIEEDIVGPLARLVAADFVQLDEHLARLEATPGDLGQSPGFRDAALGQTDAILKTMRDVLSRMVELEDFNEAVQLLRSIIQDQEQLGDAVRERRKEKVRQLLEE
ncbi:MAG: hypothetical protein ACYC6Y_26710 [Thermoguttaceae bacterium]